MTLGKILIVDDESSIRFGIRDFLEAQGYEVFEAEDCRSAESMCQEKRLDFAIIDYLLPDGNALELLPRLHEIDRDILVVILTGHGTIDLAVRAIQQGAEHFLTKPLELPTLHTILRRLLENQRCKRKLVAEETIKKRIVIDPFLGSSQVIAGLAEQARRVAAADLPVLVQGETGSGKGILADWLHTNGPRACEAFVDLNCAGLSSEFLETELFGHEKGAYTGAVANKPGLFEVAHRGTVFLDEIGDMDLKIQAKLLKVIEDKRFRRMGGIRDCQVDIRLIAASNYNLEQLVEQGRFRKDLFYRISTIPLFVPPLRQRIEDIHHLARHILSEIRSDIGIGTEIELTQDALNALVEHTWPGNIRELRNVLERAVLLRGKSVLARTDLSFSTSNTVESQSDSSDLSLQELERFHIERVLLKVHGNVEQAARVLGIPRSTLYQKIKNHQIALSKI